LIPKTGEKLKTYILLPFFFMLLAGLQAQVTGRWKSTDHVDQIEKSIVLVYEQGGKYFGKVEKLLPAATVTHCTGCEGDLKNASIVGMMIMSDISKKGNGGEGGKILDPSNGKWYSCNIELVSPDKLKVTGYLGFPLMGKAMYWNRVK